MSYLCRKAPFLITKHRIMATKAFYTLLLISLLGIASCHRRGGQPVDNANIPEATDTLQAVFHASSGQIADSIVYDVIIKNANPYDTWTTECLNGLDRKTLVDDLFRAINEGRLKTVDFDTGEELSPKEVKERSREIRKVHSRIGKIQFVENWYFDTLSLSFNKEVRSIVLGYEVYDENGEVRGYKPVFQVYLNLKNE